MAQFLLEQHFEETSQSTISPVGHTRVERAYAFRDKGMHAFRRYNINKGQVPRAFVDSINKRSNSHFESDSDQILLKNAFGSFGAFVLYHALMSYRRKAYIPLSLRRVRSFHSRVPYGRNRALGSFPKMLLLWNLCHLQIEFFNFGL